MNGLTGMRFGKLTVIKQVPNPDGNKNKRTYWLCKCDCGNEKAVWVKYLNNGSTKSCGCSRGSKAIDLIGQRFGRLTVVKRAETNNRVHWECKCDCGNTAVVQSSNLKNGNTKS